ncbi:MAG: preprotein translocase subunit SecY [Anaerolineaceae bacterium]|nr:preprotein translocase subunit SecY [Anaerolineaceae bacterium]MCY3936626.1 preprotein translocase subunit SecY [Chloroflexota bacterium]MCY4009359.1 preprotein translocase subunit SecY [Anaerolineaceae bacterium]
MIEALRNAFRVPEVRNKLLLTGFILLVYQFAIHVPVIGVDRAALQSVLSGPGAGFVGVLNLLSGGAVSNFSVLANGVYPYITASIIFQLLIPIVPALERIQREPGGQEKLQRYTYYLAIPMAVLQSLGQIAIFNAPNIGGGGVIPGFGVDLFLTATVIITMTAGTMFAIWLGDLITEQGIGNGLSVIIFAGIVAQAPTQLANLLTTSNRVIYDILLFVIITLLSIVVIIYIQEGVRRIPVQYGKRVRGRKQYGGASTHIPLKVNPVGMIPLIFAQAVTTFPAIIVNLFPRGPVGDSILNVFGNQQGFGYWAFFFCLTVGFTFFYASVMIGNQNLAENLQRNGGFIPGIRPGRRTQEYIVRVTNRITLVGALFLGTIAIVPGLVEALNGLLFEFEATTVANNPARVIAGSGLIIVVGVVIDTMRQLEAQLVMRNYEGFMR